MKNMIYLFLLLLCYGGSPKLPLLTLGKCGVIEEILKEEHLSKWVDSYENNSSIRIFDMTGTLGKMRCGYGRYSVRVEDKLMVDINTGRYIDICILSVAFHADLVVYEIFYSERTPGCKRDFLMKGKLILKKTNEKLLLIDSRFGIVN